MTRLPHRLAGVVSSPAASATSIGAADFMRCDHPTGKAGAPSLSTYRFRTSICDAHCTATMTSCDECDRGQIDLHCIGCGELKPLDDEGMCRRCFDAGEIPAAEFDLKYPCGWLLAERSAFNMPKGGAL